MSPEPTYVPLCDFCKHYNFNAAPDGAYTGDGRCEHPAHPRPSEPYDCCEDFVDGMEDSA